MFMNAHLAKFKGLDDFTANKPIGALMMARQAVRNLNVQSVPSYSGRVLGWMRSWTVEKGAEKKKKKEDAFSKVRYGDNFERNEKARPSMTHPPRNDLGQDSTVWAKQNGMRLLMAPVNLHFMTGGGNQPTRRSTKILTPTSLCQDKSVGRSPHFSMNNSLSAFSDSLKHWTHQQTTNVWR